MPLDEPRLPLRSGALAVVLTLHALALLLLARLGTWVDRGAPLPQRPPLVVWLLDEAARVAPRWPRPRPQPLESPANALRAALHSPSAPQRQPGARGGQPTQAITIPAAAEPAAAAAATTAAAASPAAAAAEPAAARDAPALDLALPRGPQATWRARSPALDDPRSNSDGGTLESRLASAMGGDGNWTMERLDEDRIRWHRGSECIETRRTRAGQLELAGGAFRNLWSAQKC